VVPEVLWGGIEGISRGFIAPLFVVMTGCNRLQVLRRGVGVDLAAFECLLYAICSAIADEVVEVLDVRETRVASRGESGSHYSWVPLLALFIDDPSHFGPMLVVILLHKIRCVHIFFWFPAIVCFGIPFPLDEVLFLLPPAVSAVPQNLFYFVLFISAYKFRGWFQEIGPMFFRLLVW
jgi:hypothetical protein